VTEASPPRPPETEPTAAATNLSRWGRRAAAIYLAVGALALAAMLVETVLGHPGTGSMFAAILAVPWSMLMAGFAPPLPSDWPMAAGLAVRMIPLALFMLLNAAIIRGIAARSERDLARATTRASLLLLLAAPFGSGCTLASRQEVMLAPPASSFLFFTGGKEEVYATFDLSQVAAWRDHHTKIARVADLAILGDFGGSAVPLDVTLFLATEPLPSFTPGVDIWQPIHLEANSTKRIDWSHGEQLMTANAATLEGEVRGDGKFTLYTVTGGTASGVSIADLHVAAVLEVK